MFIYLSVQFGLMHDPVSPCCGIKFMMSLNFQAVNKFYYPLLLFEESGKVKGCTRRNVNEWN